jgi:predicted DNA-binding transcriptional regulator AlpA
VNRADKSAALDLMTVPQVLAELGGVSRRTFYRWRELGLAPACIKLPNGELRIRRDEFREWLDGLGEDTA